MSIRRPLCSIATIHPEHLASVTREANERGRFFMAIDGTIERSAEAWERYDAERRAWSEERIAAKAFDPGFRIILAAMRACRVFGVTPKLLRETPDVPAAWLERCTVRGEGRSLEVVLDAEGARDDLGAWWWLCAHASPVVSCEAAAFDMTTLFTIGDGVHFATARFLPKSVLDHAKREATRAGIIALSPGASEHGWGMLVVGEPPLIGEVAVEAVRAFPAEEKSVSVYETLDTSILGTMESWTYWTGMRSAGLEKKLVSTLRRGAEHPDVPSDAIRALCAAEGVAVAEGRAPVTDPEGRATGIAEWVREYAAGADPFRDDTIDLALRAVERVREAASWERKEYVSEAGRAQFRAELDGLRKRLSAAQATRRVRARAPNAVPTPAFREVPLVPLYWKEITLNAMLDDAIALIAGLRDETGAKPLVLYKDLSYHELDSDWTAREVLSTIQGEPFDERTLEWQQLVAIPIYVWWPDVSPEPEVREVDGRPSPATWGHLELGLLGATRNCVYGSTLRYPTGSELKEPKFAGAGPWRDVDWKLLRKRVSAVKQLITGPLGAIVPIGAPDIWSLPAAVAEARVGRRRLLKWGIAKEVRLPD